jgi:rod shape-determining protein MreD
LVVAAILLVAVLLQTAVLARLPLPGPTPDLMLLAVIGVALALGANTGAVTGFAGGLLVAVVPPAGAPLGLAAILYAVVGFVVGSRAAGERLAWSEVAGICAAAGAITAAVGVVLTAVWGAGWPGLVVAALAVVLQAGYCALLALLVAPAVSASVAAVPGRP